MKRNEILRRNVKLSSIFHAYAFKHPKIFDVLPKGASIVYVSGRSKELDSYNLRLGLKVAKEEGRPVYKAVRKPRGWFLEPLTA